MRRISAMIVSMALLACLSVPAFAAATSAFLLQEYDVGTDAVFCYGKQLPANGNLVVSVGSRIIEEVSFSTLRQEKTPVTVYCLTDCSTSMSEKMVQQRNDVLLTLSSLMLEEDSMVLATVDAVLTESKPMDTQNARDTAINTITGQSWYTNLYDGISSAMKALHASNAYNTNRCLVILSDGHDDQKSTATEETIQKQIREAGIPVYTVILGDSITERELTQQRRFAEESLGGFMTYPDREGVSAAAAAQQIWHSIKEASVIRIGAEELRVEGTDQQLLIRYDAGDIRYEDSILVRAVDLPVAAVAAEETEEIVEETAAEEGNPAEEESWTILLACGIGVILLGGGVVTFLLSRKKAESIENEEKQSADSVDAWDTIPVTVPNDADHMVNDFSIGGVTVPVESSCHVHAVAIMHPEITADFYVARNMEVTFGRTEKADIILNKDDKKLSSLHGCFFWNGEMLLVQDRKSTNGTAINGEICPQNVWLRVDNGAVLTAGQFEYRINFK